MAFQVILTAAPTEDLREVWLSLEFISRQHTQPFYQGKVAFGEPSSVQGRVFDFPGPGFDWNVNESRLKNFVETAQKGENQEPALFDLRAHLNTGNGTAGFTLRNLGSNDTFHFLGLSRRLFLGNALHGYPGMGARGPETPCVATCADGKSAQGCVTCTQGGITVRVCC